MNTAMHPWALAGAAMAISACALKAHAADPSNSVAPLEATPVVEAQALRVVRDKETGKLRSPTNDELPALLEAERAVRKARGDREPTAAAAPLALRQHSNGMLSAVLGPDYLITVKAQRGPDGKPVVTHANPASEHPTAPSQRPTE